MSHARPARRVLTAVADSPSLGRLRVIRDREGVKLLAHGILYAIHADRLTDTPSPWLALAASVWMSGRPTPPRRVALLGYGGGTLARLLRQADPALRLVGVEPDAAVRRLAQTHLASRTPNVRLRATDAAAFLRSRVASDRAPFDAILDDIYAPTRGRLGRPSGLEVLPALARRRLAPGGVYSVSLRSPGGAEESAMLAATRQAFRHVRVVYTREWAHRVLVASDTPIPRGSLTSGLARLFGDPLQTPRRTGLGPVRTLPAARR